MSTFTLDDIREAADKEFGSMFIEIDEETTVELVNALRLSKDKRKQLRDTQKLLDADDAEGDEDDDNQEKVLEDTLRIVCKTKSQANALIRELNGDLAVLAKVFQNYAGGTELGEA